MKHIGQKGSPINWIYWSEGNILELFSFPDSPNRSSYPEARGPSHFAFEVDDINQAIENLEKKTFLVNPSVLMS